ncbi:GNAT family N-acetyltransferase [Undibacterium sp.]|uniref:GNAT family N-acetyltransferase n=1 Tax=Undibacterium sp. TaxID=1914977 RepID=UPI002D7FBAF3|nr:GNAT family N-acetyltransferase [Undibacterium sp.]
MIKKGISGLRKHVHTALRKLSGALPRSKKFSIYRSFVRCDPAPKQHLILKIAETKEELEACFALLHDAYVSSGFMNPDQSGMRVTPYHALPTTTTLCAKYNGEVVGTLSLIRENAMGFPLQHVFDLTEVRKHEGNIAEVSALAVHRRFRKTGGSILFPLMKFMYEYCTTFFDTRHLVIAVNPNHIEMYESLLFFKRLAANPVENYDFVNGAPAVGAWLDLKFAPEVMKKHYGTKPAHRNLHAYFTMLKMPNIKLPLRRYYTTNDPVLTPELLDHFFNQRTEVFANLSERQKLLLHSIYDIPEYLPVLPTLSSSRPHAPIRRHERFSMRCPGQLTIKADDGAVRKVDIDVVQVSTSGFLASIRAPIPLQTWGNVMVKLGKADVSYLQVEAVRSMGKDFYGFTFDNPDTNWKTFVSALYQGSTHKDLQNASSA